jgi:ABC-type lipoprotein export system ATPase subunit
VRVEVGSELVRSGRVMQLEAIFDVPPSERANLAWDVSLPLDEQDSSVGLIVGPSGSGKSTVAKALWPGEVIAGHDWPERHAILDAFPDAMGTQEIAQLLSAVGLGSVPSWLRPFSVLSTGEQFRATVARALAEATTGTPVVIDEFTSVVDRQVAKVGSHAVQKTVRRRGLQLVAVTCHFDVIDWLQPDWVYRVDADDFGWRRLQRHPRVDVGVAHVDRRAWELFRVHHYMTSQLPPSAFCVCGYVEGEAVAFECAHRFPHPKARDIFQSARTVVLPDWQGLGIGNLMIEFMGELVCARGFRLHGTAAHPVVVKHFAKSPRWKLLVKQAVSSTSTRASLREQHTQLRKLGLRSAEYVPRFPPPIDQGGLVRIGTPDADLGVFWDGTVETLDDLEGDPPYARRKRAVERFQASTLAR